MATMAQTGSAGIVRGASYDSRFFSTMAVLILATTAIGFSRTYYLNGLFHAPLPSRIIHLHALVFTLWILLYVVQTALVPIGRIAIHKKLGIAAFGFACVTVAVGVMAGTDMLVRNDDFGTGIGAKTFCVIPFGTMAIFAPLMLGAFLARRAPDVHKRLILIANIALTFAPVARHPLSYILDLAHTDQIFQWSFLAMLVSYDLLSLHKIHKATLAGGIFVVVTLHYLILIGMTSGWIAFAGWAQSMGRALHL